LHEILIGIIPVVELDAAVLLGILGDGDGPLPSPGHFLVEVSVPRPCSPVLLLLLQESIPENKAVVIE